MPFRWIFRSRWAALIWAGGICLSAVRFAGGEMATVDAAHVADNRTAATSALNAEDPE